MRRPAIPNCRSTWPHGQTRTGQAEPNRKFCSVPGPSSRTFGWIFAKMRHFFSHLSPGRGPFPSKFPNFGLQNVPIVSHFTVSRASCLCVHAGFELRPGKSARSGRACLPSIGKEGADCRSKGIFLPMGDHGILGSLRIAFSPPWRLSTSL